MKAIPPLTYNCSAIRTIRSAARGDFDDIQAQKRVAGSFATLGGPWRVLDVGVHRFDGVLTDRPDLSYTLRDALGCDVGGEESRGDGRERDGVRTAAATPFDHPTGIGREVESRGNPFKMLR